MNLTSHTQTQISEKPKRGPNKALANARELAGLSHRELGYMADVSHVTIFRLELGLCEPRRRTKRLIAEALGVEREILWPSE